MTPPTESFAEGLLRRLADAIYHRPRAFFYPQMLLALVCLLYTVAKLEIHSSRNELVGGDKKYHQNFLQFKKEFPGQDDLVAIVESDDLEKNRQFVERLGAKLEARTNLFVDVFYKGDLKLMGPKALLFVPEDQLVEMRKALHDYRPFISTFSQATNLSSLFTLVNRQFRTTPQEATPETEAMIGALPALERIIRHASDSLARPGMPPSPGIYALFGEAEEAEKELYINFANGRLYLVTAHARSEDKNPEAVQELRRLVQETKREVSGVNVGITGEPVLEYDEMRQSEKDTMVATIVALVLCAVIFIYGYQESGRPIKATACLVVGLIYTMGYTTLVVGHLNILTITFLPILIGLAIDFGVHLVTRYEEELRHGATEQQALRKAMVNTGMGIFTGCFTTAGAFFAMSLTDFKGIQEMGLISGGGLLICLAPMMTLLPVLLLRGRQNILDHQLPQLPDTRSRIEKIWLERPVTVLCITVALCAGAIVLGNRKVHFDYNLLNMQSKGLPAVVFEKKLIESGSNSVLFAAVIATDAKEAAELEDKLAKLSTVSTNRSMSQYLSEDQTQKLKLVAEIKKEIAGIQFPPVDRRPVNVEELSQVLYSFGGYLGTIAEEVKKRGEKDLEKQFLHMRDTADELRVRMLAGDRQKNGDKLAAYQFALLDDLQDTIVAIQTQDDRERLKIEDLPSALRNRFIGVTGKYLIQVFPKHDVWQREHQETFVAELRTIDPDVTGTPVQLLEYTTLLKDSYIEAAWYSLGAIAILVFVHFRSFLCVILALLPVGVGTLWMVGFMALADVPFNPANIMTLPLVVGIGVTNGIHILNRFAEERTPSILAKSTGKAVIVSGLTTIAGFGSLVIAKHQGIQSLGFIMAVGTATCMTAGLTLLPAVLRMLTRAGWTIKKPSGNNALSPLGREEPR
ncbi:MAG: MMPL family transporter [Verrucomicrobiota bacterium]